MDRCFPSLLACLDMPVLYHPAIRTSLLVPPSLVEGMAVRKMGNLLRWSVYLKGTSAAAWTRVSSITDAITRTRWSPWVCFRSPSQSLGPGVRAWPSMAGALGCAGVLGDGPSLLTSWVGIAPFKAPAASVPFRLVKRLYAAPDAGQHRMALCDLSITPPPPAWTPAPGWSQKGGNRDSMSVWTNGSTVHNGDERCIARASWCVENGVSMFARLAGITPNNNLAEVAVVVMALLSWSPATSTFIQTPGSCSDW